MKAATRLALLDGAYICQYAFPREYAYLCEPGNADEVNKWLGDIDMRLLRLGDDGAFVMTPLIVTPADTLRIRDEFARFRDVYGPAVRMLQLIRTANDNFQLAPGVYVQLAELNQAVNENPTLEAKLRGLSTVIRDGSARLRNSELLKRLLDHLTRDGFLVVINANSEVYQTTGKVTQLVHVLNFVAENTDIAGSLSEAEEGAVESGLFEGDDER